MKRTILLLSILLFAVAMSAPALAGSVLTITDVVKVDGKIGLYIRNEVGLKMNTDNSEDNVSVLNYKVENTSVFSIPSKSKPEIKTDEIKLVVIDHNWPESGYYTLSVSFTDTSGHAYDPETEYAFAKPALEVIEAWTEPKMVTSNSSFILYLKTKASGEGDVSDIDLTYVSHPKYYTYVSHTDLPDVLKKDETTTYSFTYKLSGQGMPETIIYETISAPIQASYMYLNKSDRQLINQSIVVYNRLAVGDTLPELKSLIDVSNTLVSGNTLDIPVFVWNTKAGSHSACKLNLTLSEASGTFKIPISNILPGDKTFPPAAEQSSDPTALFKIEIPESAAEGDYTLKISGIYEDCEWKAPQS
ncbi:MAG: hypothetical protein ABIF92_02285, partial [archaeon]